MRGTIIVGLILAMYGVERVGSAVSAPTVSSILRGHARSAEATSAAETVFGRVRLLDAASRVPGAARVDPGHDRTVFLEGRVSAVEDLHVDERFEGDEARGDGPADVPGVAPEAQVRVLVRHRFCRGNMDWPLGGSPFKTHVVAASSWIAHDSRGCDEVDGYAARIDVAPFAPSAHGTDGVFFHTGGEVWGNISADVVPRIQGVLAAFAHGAEARLRPGAAVPGASAAQEPARNDLGTAESAGVKRDKRRERRENNADFRSGFLYLTGAVRIAAANSGSLTSFGVSLAGDGPASASNAVLSATFSMSPAVLPRMRVTTAYRFLGHVGGPRWARYGATFPAPAYLDKVLSALFQPVRAVPSVAFTVDRDGLAPTIDFVVSIKDRRDAPRVVAGLLGAGVLQHGQGDALLRAVAVSDTEGSSRVTGLRLSFDHSKAEGGAPMNHVITTHAILEVSAIPSVAPTLIDSSQNPEGAAAVAHEDL